VSLELSAKKRNPSMTFAPVSIALALLAPSLVMSSACIAASESFSIISNGHVVGSLEAITEGSSTTIDFKVSENGRGPSSHEEMVIDSDGIPVHWIVVGKSLVGAPMQEQFDWKRGKLSWRGEADSGKMVTVKPRLYLANDASPWAYGVYARAALKAPDLKVNVTPSGTLRIEKVGSIRLNDASDAPDDALYALSGLWMSPQYVVLDADHALVASEAGDMLLVRKGLEAHTDALRSLFEKTALDRMRSLQLKLAHHFDTPIRIENIHVFDPQSGTISPLQMVEVYRQHITRVGANSAIGPKQGEVVVVDGEGGTLIPGLHDMHSHTSIGSGLYNIAAGVTAARDMGNSNAFLLDLMPRLDSGELPGPRITPNGFIEGVSPYSASTGILAPSLAEALEDIGWYADHGYWQVKIYNSIDPSWVKSMAAEAHRLGMTVTGHIPAMTTADQMIRDGYDEVAHINQLMFQWVLKPGEDTRTTLRITALDRFADVDLKSPRVQASFELMREHHAVLDTTAVIQERLALSRAGKSQRGEWPYLEHVPISYQRFRKRNIVVTKTPQDERRYERAVDKMLATIKQLYDNGNRLMPGTDDDNGLPKHRELELYVLAGISPAETLRIDTLGAAEYLKQDQNFGSIERGKIADLVLLPGDPTKNISLVRQPRLVMRGGALYFPDEIYTALDIKPFSVRPQLHTVNESHNTDAGSKAAP
jgi:hypothetical protein